MYEMANAQSDSDSPQIPHMLTLMRPLQHNPANSQLIQQGFKTFELMHEPGIAPMSGMITDMGPMPSWQACCLSGAIRTHLSLCMSASTMPNKRSGDHAGSD
jgi:hypothetical protein